MESIPKASFLLTICNNTNHFHITEIELVRDKLLTTIPRMSTEWSVSFEFKMTGVLIGWSNIIHFTIGGNMFNIGDRIPAVFVRGESKGFHFNFPVNEIAIYDWDFNETIQQNRVYNIGIHQRYVSNGN